MNFDGEAEDSSSGYQEEDEEEKNGRHHKIFAQWRWALLCVGKEQGQKQEVEQNVDQVEEGTGEQLQ
jgi:hypothetical protein